MKITKVCCQGCGADLDIDEGIRFVTREDYESRRARLMAQLERARRG